MTDAPEPAWLELLDELQRRSPEFVTRFLAELRERALYDPESVPGDDLESAALETVLMFIERLRSGQITRTDFAGPLGRRRARQGVPLERLMQAIRLDLRIMWQLLLEIAQPDATEVLMRHVEQLISVVDAYVADVQQAFLAEMATLQRDSRLATEQHLSKLFNARSLNPALLDEIAAGIGVQASGAFEVLLLPDVSPETRSSEVDAWLAQRSVFAYVYRGWLLLFRACEAQLSTWPREFRRVPSIYIDAVEGLQLLPEAARALIDLQAGAPPLQRLTQLEEFWVVGAAEYLDALVPGYFRAILAPLGELGADEHDRLLRTVHAYLDSGSVKDTAELVDCHRNTVINRFRQFQSLTGLDITVPAQAALAYVLLRGAAHRAARPSASAR